MSRAARGKTFLGQVMQTLSTRVMGLVLAVPTSVLLARGLVPASRGAYTVILTSVAMTSLLTGLGLAPANVRFAARNPGERGALLGNSITYSLLVGLTAFLVLLPLRGTLDLSTVSSLAAGLLVTLTLFSGYAANILLGAQLIARYNVAQLVEFVTRLLTFAAVFFFSRGMWQFIFAYTITLALKCAFVLIALRNTVGSIVPSWPLFLRQVKFGLPLHMSTVLRRVNSSLSIYTLRFSHGDAAVGYYAIPQNYLASAKILPTTLASLLLPRVAASENDVLKDQTAKLLRMMLVLFTAGTGAFYFVIPPLFSLLYGPEYADAIPAARIIIFAFPFYAYSQVSSNYMIGSGRTKFFIRLASWSFVAGLAALVLLVPPLGVRGAALSVVVMELASFAYCTATMVRTGGFSLRRMFVPVPGDIRFLGTRIREIFRRAEARHR